MKYNTLNPLVRSAALYERINRTDECIGYDCRIFYVISGDLTAVADGVKLGHLSPGNLLYIPAGTPYKLKSNYVRMIAITFDLTTEWAEKTDRIVPVAKDSFDDSLLHPAIIEPFNKVIFIKDAEGMRDEFTDMSRIYTSGEGDFLDELSARVKLILLRLAREKDESALPSQMVMALDEYIRENCRDEISNTEIGAVLSGQLDGLGGSQILCNQQELAIRQLEAGVSAENVIDPVGHIPNVRRTGIHILVVHGCKDLGEFLTSVQSGNVGLLSSAEGV